MENNENIVDIDINFDQIEWQKILQRLYRQFKKTLDLQGIIFLIGHREVGLFQEKLKKEEKENLIHVGVCTLLARCGYYIFVENDADGWPHFELDRRKPKLSNDQQEQLLKKMIIDYFKEFEI